jgi:hypothetical protein
MDELPYWRVVMRRERDGAYGDSRLRRMAREHAEAIDEMRAVLRERSTVTNRDFEMASRTRTQSYRGRKDSALALYYLWCTGEVMTHHREHFERVYVLMETVAPASLIRESDEAEADRFLIKKDVSFSGLSRPSRVAESFRGYGESDRATKQLLGAMLADGDLIEVQVEDWKAVHYALGSDAGVLRELSAGLLPPAWTPLETTTTEEVVFLAPLDHVSARGRARVLFGFDYVWEVYKPEQQRRLSIAAKNSPKVPLHRFIHNICTAFAMAVRNRALDRPEVFQSGPPPQARSRFRQSHMDSRRVDKYGENRAEWKESKLLFFGDFSREWVDHSIGSKHEAGGSRTDRWHAIFFGTHRSWMPNAAIIWLIARSSSRETAFWRLEGPKYTPARCKALTCMA